jgi:hypothetical protein
MKQVQRNVMEKEPGFFKEPDFGSLERRRVG